MVEAERRVFILQTGRQTPAPKLGTIPCRNAVHQPSSIFEQQLLQRRNYSPSSHYHRHSHCMTCQSSLSFLTPRAIPSEETSRKKPTRLSSHFLKKKFETSSIKCSEKQTKNEVDHRNSVESITVETDSPCWYHCERAEGDERDEIEVGLVVVGTALALVIKATVALLAFAVVGVLHDETAIVGAGSEGIVWAAWSKGRDGWLCWESMTWRT